MYTSLLAKQQLKTIVHVLQKQLVTATTVILSDNVNVVSARNLHQSHNQVIDIANPLPKVLGTKTRLYSHAHRENSTTGKVLEEHETFSYVDEVDVAQNIKFRHLLYDEMMDDNFRRLNACENFEQLKDTLEKLEPHLQKEHIVQTVILLWALSRKLYANNQVETDTYLLEKTCRLLSEHITSLNINEISTCYLYLRKMGVDNTQPLLQELLIRALREVETIRGNDVIGLPALSRLVVGINTGRHFFTPMLCAHFMEHLNHHVVNCSSDEDARMIAICMLNMQPLINDEMINMFKEKVEHLLSTGEISMFTPKSVLKILIMLNMAVWSHRHVNLIRNLLVAIKPVISQLEVIDLKNVCRIYQYHLEPACIQQPLAEALEKLLSTHMSPENLALFVPFSHPQKRETLVNAFKALLSSSDSWQQHNSLGYFFSTLRALKISDSKICNTYWNGVLNELNTLSEDEMQTKFLKHCHRYMNFNNNLGGTYRHMALEKKLSQLCMHAIEHDLAGRIPPKFARLASFVLAYGHTPYSWKKYPNVLLSKIITMVDQFTPMDCFLISRGLQISLEMRYRFQIPQLVSMQLSTIDSVLTSCAERHLNDEQLQAHDINMIVKTLSNRKSLKNSVVYHRTLQKYKEIQCHDLNSRIIKDMAYNFMATNYFAPEVLESMFQYLENNYDHVVGDTVEKILTCSYNTGYTPQSYEALEYAGLVLLRDFNYMSGLSLVQACLALCYYKTIPEELINKVFCVKFIQRVEDEIQMCYSKATYPERVLNIVMQLNRSVCLDFPEANVPWFQQNFIEAQISKKPYVETTFSNDVKQLLSTVLKDESHFRCNHTTPYGYQIDFVINFDKDKKPIQAPIETTMLDRITKVAILLLKLDSFCANDLNALRGPESLKIKHLEMMGYKVLHINEHDWNTKYMKVPGAKTKYLKCLLQISN